MRRLVPILALVLPACGGGGGQAAPVGGSVTPPAAVAPGDRSHLLLRSEPRRRVHVEVTPVVGREPDATALVLLLERVRAVCDKPDGVTGAVLPAVPAAVQSDGSPRRWTSADLDEFERTHRRTEDVAELAVVFVAYLDGHWADEPKRPGRAYGDHGIAVFRDHLPPGAEAHVLVHALGHLLGLVNGRTPALSAHGASGHCAEPLCVMHREVADSPFPPTDFDALCRADLEAIARR